MIRGLLIWNLSLIQDDVDCFILMYYIINKSHERIKLKIGFSIYNWKSKPQRALLSPKKPQSYNSSKHGNFLWGTARSPSLLKSKHQTESY
jgi:hypothetical protein